MRSLIAPLFFFALAACSSSTPDAPGSGGPTGTLEKADAGCAPPAGYVCCTDQPPGYTCDAKGAVVCDPGTILMRASECVAPPRFDGGLCRPPAGYECCDGDVIGTSSCGADGGVVCSSGTRLTPSNECTIAAPLDAGPDATDAAHE